MEKPKKYLSAEEAIKELRKVERKIRLYPALYIFFASFILSSGYWAYSDKKFTNSFDGYFGYVFVSTIILYIFGGMCYFWKGK